MRTISGDREYGYLIRLDNGGLVDLTEKRVDYYRDQLEYESQVPYRFIKFEAES